MWSRVLKFLTGDTSPNIVAYSVILGVFSGLLPIGWTEPKTFLVLALLLVTRANLRFFLAVAAPLQVLMLIGMWKIVAQTGRWALEIEALEGFWRAFVNLPGVALFQFWRFEAMGGLIWACGLSLVLGPAFYLGVAAYKRRREAKAYAGAAEAA